MIFIINLLQTSAGVLRARAWAATKPDRLRPDDLFISADTDEVRCYPQKSNFDETNKQTNKIDLLGELKHSRKQQATKITQVPPIQGDE